MQAQYDAYVANEVFPFIDSQCQTPRIGIAMMRVGRLETVVRRISNYNAGTAIPDTSGKA